MPHEIFKDTTYELAWELFLRDRNKQETKPTIASGIITILGPSGEIVVPATAVSVSNGNRVAFLTKPSSGTATVGAYKQIWDIFIGPQSYVHSDSLIIKERF